MAKQPTTAKPRTRKTAALAPTKTPRARKAPEAKVEAAPATVAAEAPKPLPGTSNRFTYQSVTPDQAYHYASLAHGLELDFGNDEKAMRRYRTRLYAINKEFAGKWRFRTIRENSVLMIWRLAY